MSAAEAVQNGVKLLNKHHPGWHNQIDLSILDIANATRCICGQLGIWHTDLDLNNPRVAESYGMLQSGYADYPELTEEWRKTILAQREEVLA